MLAARRRGIGVGTPSDTITSRHVHAASERARVHEQQMVHESETGDALKMMSTSGVATQGRRTGTRIGRGLGHLLRRSRRGCWTRMGAAC